MAATLPSTFSPRRRRRIPIMKAKMKPCGPRRYPLATAERNSPEKRGAVLRTGAPEPPPKMMCAGGMVSAGVQSAGSQLGARCIVTGRAPWRAERRSLPFPLRRASAMPRRPVTTSSASPTGPNSLAVTSECPMLMAARRTKQAEGAGNRDRPTKPSPHTMAARRPELFDSRCMPVRTGRRRATESTSQYSTRAPAARLRSFRWR